MALPTLLLLACCLPLAAPLPQEEAGTLSIFGSHRALIEVFAGRVTVAGEDGLRHVLPTKERHITTGRTHLEIPAGGRARVLWSGLVSMAIRGPSTLEWSTIDAESLEMILHDLSAVDIEVRRGKHKLFLPGHWQTTMGAGAFHVSGKPAGAVNIHSMAGAPLELRWVGLTRYLSPSLWLDPGEEFQLGAEGPPLALESDKLHLAAWSDSSWPWRALVDTPRMQTERLRLDGMHLRQSVGPAAWPEANYEAGTQHLSMPGLFGRDTFDWLLERAPVRVAAQSSEEQGLWADSAWAASKSLGPAVGSVTAAELFPRGNGYMPSHWRGVMRAELIPAGPLVVQSRKGVDVQADAAGRWRVVHALGVHSPVWVFGPTYDYLMHPGAMAVFSAQGLVLTKRGDVHFAERIEGRPGVRAPRPILRSTDN